MKQTLLIHATTDFLCRAPEHLRVVDKPACTNVVAPCGCLHCCYASIQPTNVSFTLKTGTHYHTIPTYKCRNLFRRIDGSHQEMCRLGTFSGCTYFTCMYTASIVHRATTVWLRRIGTPLTCTHFILLFSQSEKQ